MEHHFTREEKGGVRRVAGITAIKVRGVVVHPECRTDEEVCLTVELYKEAPDGDCPRCHLPLHEEPHNEEES